MKTLQGPIINPFFLREGDMASASASECLETAVLSSCSNSAGSSAVEMGYENLVAGYHIPFLQLLQSAMCAGGVRTDGEIDEEEPLRAFERPPESCVTTTTNAVCDSRERKRRKRSRPATGCKSPEEAESQRMTHIAVERNRRRLMNDHLAALRSLMPTAYVQRGDQASVVGGAIDFVKELEQLFHSLQAEKRLRSATVAASPTGSNDEVAFQVTIPPQGFFVSPQYTTHSQATTGAGVDVEATVVQGHVNLKIASPRRQGQLVRAVAALEELRLSVLHLNVTSLDASSMLYCFNLKMEEECKMGTADEIATAAHQIFCYINAS